MASKCEKYAGIGAFTSTYSPLVGCIKPRQYA